MNAPSNLAPPSLAPFVLERNDERGAACSIILHDTNDTPAANVPFWKPIVTFFFRFGVCPMCMTASMSYSIYELVRFRHLRDSHSLWAAKR